VFGSAKLIDSEYKIHSPHTHEPPAAAARDWAVGRIDRPELAIFLPKSYYFFNYLSITSH
jgi:hypothetical protein